MADVNLTGFPDDLLTQLRQRASTNGRGVSDELVEAARDHLARDLTAAEKLAIAERGRRRSPHARLDPAIVARICRGSRP